MKTSLFQVINMLSEKRIHFCVIDADIRSITLLVTLVGKRLEVYLNDDGEIDFSIFVGNEDIKIGMDALAAELD